MFSTGTICSPRVKALMSEGLRQSPLNSASGGGSQAARARRTAVTKRAAPPTGSTARGSMLYT